MGCLRKVALRLSMLFHIICPHVCRHQDQSMQHGCLSGLHHGFEKWKKPFNPILGETWQADMCDGSTMYMEQISHHPPVSAFHLEGPGVLSANI